MGSIRIARLIANLLLGNVTIERRGRKGRKVRQDLSAAFAALVFQCGVAMRRLGYAACTNATHPHLTLPLASKLPRPTDGTL